MFDLEDFAFAGMTQVGADLRKLGVGAESMEEVGNRIVRYLYDHFTSKTSRQRGCVLVRLFKTHSFGELDEELRQFVTPLLHGTPASPEVKCLTLLATAGERQEWNSRRTSDRHKAIPLASEAAIENSPMISQLFSQLGLSFSALQRPDPLLMMDTGQSSFNVFYIPNAQGSPYVPAQKEFVTPYGVKSVVGFGGLLPTGDFFAVILFSRVHIRRESAELFKTLALSTRLALVSVAKTRVFA